MAITKANPIAQVWRDEY